MGKVYKQIDKRVASRLDTQISVIIREMDGEDEIERLLDRDKKEIKTDTLNISLSGMSLVGCKTLKVGEKLNLDIMLPGTTVIIRAIAEVVRSNEKGAGIHFLAMKKGGMKTLKTYLDDVASKSNQKKGLFSRWLHF